MADKNYYDILGVKRDASPDQIKKAFHKLAQKYHPDAGGDEAKFKEISEAYDTLSDEEKRRTYDQFLAFGGIPGAGRGYSSYGQGSVDFQDILNSIRNGEGAFGGFDFGSFFNQQPRGRSPRPAKGGDLTLHVDVTAQESFEGVTRKVTYKVPSTGETQSITVKVPAGAVDGGRLRYRGRGEYGTAGGPRGDLVVVTRVAEHPVFKRDGADVNVALPISVYDAALGCEVTIPTPAGKKIKLKVPAGVQTGKRFRFKDMGLPNVRRKGSTGAMYVTVEVRTPTRLASREREQLTQLRDADNRTYRKEIDDLLAQGKA